MTKKEKNSLMMLKKLHLTFSVIVFYFFNVSFLKADLLIPKVSILPAEVVKIQLKIPLELNVLKLLKMLDGI